MPDIKPFRALVYAPSKVQLDDVVAPPYDVISALRQRELYERSPYNVVRLILGREHDRYGSAAACLQAWKREAVIVPDARPALYAVSERFPLPGGAGVAERRGFIAACRLTEFGQGSVYAHERTFSKPKEDRFRLFQATGLMCSQIFGIYSDPERHIDRKLEPVTGRTPFLEARFDGVEHRLWRIEEPETVSLIGEYIRRQRVFIADGHHRYDTALQYSNFRRLENPRHTGKEAYNFVPMFFANMSSPGLVIFPTHRLVHGIAGFTSSGLLAALDAHFQRIPAASLEELSRALAGEKKHAFGLVLAPSAGEDSSGFLLLRLRDSVPLTRMGGKIPSILASLDVTILHSLILRDILHMSEEDQEARRFLEYEKDPSRCVEAVREGDAQAAFILNPTRVEQVRAVAEAGLVMPQKSTYFYPKLLSGFVMYSFLDE